MVDDGLRIETCDEPLAHYICYIFISLTNDTCIEVKFIYVSLYSGVKNIRF